MRSHLHKEKLREIAECLVRCGRVSIDAQAKALGISRSTAWTILSGKYKVSGISARVIKQIMCSPDLPPEVRAKILEYVSDKASGKFGCNQVRLRRFKYRMAALGLPIGEPRDQEEQDPKQTWSEAASSVGSIGRRQAKRTG